MLLQELSPLRDMTPRLGCYIWNKDWGKIDTHIIAYVSNAREYEFDCRTIESYDIFDVCDNQIIGHPLTRGKLYKHNLDNNNPQLRSIFDKMLNLFKKNTDMIDKTEVDRMQNKEFWEKLYPLLVEYSQTIK